MYYKREDLESCKGLCQGAFNRVCVTDNVEELYKQCFTVIRLIINILEIRKGILEDRNNADIWI